MAENKKSFILYCDLIHTIKKLPDDKAGLLFKHLLSYVNDENPITDDLLVEVAFEPIKRQLKRDLETWENELIKKGESGALGNLKRWNEDLYNKVINKELSLQKAIEIAKHRKASHPDKSESGGVANVAVTVTDTVTVNETNNIEQRKLKFSETLTPFIESYGKELIDEFYSYWTESNKSGKKFRQELQVTWDLSRRLKTWSKNNFGNPKQNTGKKHYYLLSCMGRWDGFLTQEEFEAKTKTGYWTLEKVI